MRPCSTPSGMVDSLTNSARRPAEEAIEAAGLLAWIECVIASDEARAHTPSLAVYRSHPIEQALLDGDVLAYESHQTDASGVNSTFYVEIAPDIVAFHKPHEGLVARIARNYDHSLDTPPICECAAWQLAKNLGEPYGRLAAVTVYRAVGPPEADADSWGYGSRALRHEGAAMQGMAVQRDARDDALAAGFFRRADRQPGPTRWPVPIRRRRACARAARPRVQLPG